MLGIYGLDDSNSRGRVGLCALGKLSPIAKGLATRALVCAVLGSTAPVLAADSSVAASAQQALPLPDDVLAAMQAAGVPASALALAVIDPAGHMIYQHRADQPMLTASLMKLVLTLGALEQLGPAFRFHTDLFADPLPQPRQGWQVTVRGGGDPGLQQDALRLMLRHAAALGVHRIGAPVILDTRRFAPQTTLGTGVRAEPGRVWTTLPSALMVDLAAVTLSLPAAHQGQLLLDPPIGMLAPVASGGANPQRPAASPAANVPAAVRVPEASPCPPDWLDQLALVVAPARPLRQHAAHAALGPVASAANGTLSASTGESSEDWRQPGRLQLQGEWPANCPAGELRRSPLPASAHFGWTLAALWRSLGHHESVSLQDGAAPGYATVTVRQASRPLAELVRDINKYSNNLMARTLLLDLAAEQGELPATTLAGEHVLKRWLEGHQMHFEELSIENGAGLSHQDKLTADHLAQLLKYALTSPVAPEFLASLSIPGQDGTLLKRFTNLPGAAGMRLKTGSLDDVRGLAGFVPYPGGGYSVVVCMINGPGLSDVGAIHEAVLRAASDLR